MTVSDLQHATSIMDDRERQSALIIHNPIAGRPLVHRSVAQLAQALRRDGWQVDVTATTSTGHATALAAEAARMRYGVVVAAGGDGTINEVIQALVGTRTVLGVLPIGTTNVWAAETAIPSDPRRLADLLTNGRPRCVDVGRAGARYFLLMAGVGFDAAVVQGVGLRLKRRLGRLAYAITAARLAGRYAGTPMTVRLDGRELRCTVLMMVIANTRRYAGSFRLTPNALVDDGCLDVCIVPGARLARSPTQIGAVLTGLAPLRRGLLTLRAAQIEIERPALPMQVDGDFAGLTPVTIDVVPRALRVQVDAEHAGGVFSAHEGLSQSESVKRSVGCG